MGGQGMDMESMAQMMGGMNPQQGGQQQQQQQQQNPF